MPSAGCAVSSNSRHRVVDLAGEHERYLSRPSIASAVRRRYAYIADFWGRVLSTIISSRVDALQAEDTGSHRLDQRGPLTARANQLVARNWDSTAVPTDARRRSPTRRSVALPAIQAWPSEREGRAAALHAAAEPREEVARQDRGIAALRRSVARPGSPLHEPRGDADNGGSRRCRTGSPVKPQSRPEGGGFG
jgi:hypothetical protein